jgi:hypothetical protein
MAGREKNALPHFENCILRHGVGAGRALKVGVGDEAGGMLGVRHHRERRLRGKSRLPYIYPERQLPFRNYKQPDQKVVKQVDRHS